MKQVNKKMKNEGIIKTILAVVGVLTFGISTDFAWGFIIGGIVTKENIDLKTKEGWGLLALVSGAIVLAIYILLELPAVFGFIVSTISYFILRAVFEHFENNN